MDLEKEVNVSEVHLHDIMFNETLSKKAQLALTCKAKLLDAAFKEKEFDGYFALAMSFKESETLSSWSLVSTSRSLLKT